MHKITDPKPKSNANGFVSSSIKNQYPRELKISASGEKFYRDLKNVNVRIMPQLKLPTLEERVAFTSNPALYELSVQLMESDDSETEQITETSEEDRINEITSLDLNTTSDELNSKSDVISYKKDDLNSKSEIISYKKDGQISDISSFKEEFKKIETESEIDGTTGCVTGSVTGGVSEGGIKYLALDKLKGLTEGKKETGIEKLTEKQNKAHPSINQAEQQLEILMDLEKRLENVGKQDTDNYSTTAVQQFPLSKSPKRGKIRNRTTKMQKLQRPAVNANWGRHTKTIKPKIHSTTQTFTGSNTGNFGKFIQIIPEDFGMWLSLIMLSFTIFYFVYVSYIDVSEYLNTKWHYERLMAESNFCMKAFYFLINMFLGY